ncbi:unnamed protein product [Protopolystoma xenopodis]|uniref:Uncharacterized protein n=1 Tax=Protopolystoma xenopodis TaxID=117903 RepID=A0A3S5CIZ9_9PLAT|nr:unnamed protein product [Protopolystoma xenopodis]
MSSTDSGVFSTTPSGRLSGATIGTGAGASGSGSSAYNAYNAYHTTGSTATAAITSIGPPSIINNGPIGSTSSIGYSVPFTRQLPERSTLQHVPISSSGTGGGNSGRHPMPSASGPFTGGSCSVTGNRGGNGVGGGSFQVMMTGGRLVRHPGASAINQQATTGSSSSAYLSGSTAGVPASGAVSSQQSHEHRQQQQQQHASIYFSNQSANAELGQSQVLMESLTSLTSTPTPSPYHHYQNQHQQSPFQHQQSQTGDNIPSGGVCEPNGMRDWPPGRSGTTIGGTGSSSSWLTPKPRAISPTALPTVSTSPLSPSNGLTAPCPIDDYPFGPTASDLVGGTSGFRGHLRGTTMPHSKAQPCSSSPASSSFVLDPSPQPPSHRFFPSGTGAITFATSGRLIPSSSSASTSISVSPATATANGATTSLLPIGTPTTVISPVAATTAASSITSTGSACLLGPGNLSRTNSSEDDKRKAASVGPLGEFSSCMQHQGNHHHQQTPPPPAHSYIGMTSIYPGGPINSSAGGAGTGGRGFNFFKTLTTRISRRCLFCS